MSNIKFSQLPNLGGNLTGTETVPVVSGGVNYNITTDQIANLAIANVPPSYGNANVAAYLPTYTGTLAGDMLQITGTATNSIIGGNVFFTGNVNIAGNTSNISGNSGVFYGNLQTGFGALYAGLGTGGANIPQTILEMVGSYNGYTQINAQNINAGNAASTDLVLTANNGDDTNYFIDLGIAGSGWDGNAYNSLGPIVNANDGYLYVQGIGGGGNLIIGTGGYQDMIKMTIGGGNASNVSATIFAPGYANTLAVNGGITASLITTTGASGNIANVNYLLANTVVANYVYGDGSAMTFPNFTGSIGGNAWNSIAIGNQAGIAQGSYAISIGYNTGRSNHGSGAVAIGYSAGNNNQGINGVSLGNYAGNNLQGSLAVAIGGNAAVDSQAQGAVAIGQGAGTASQGNTAVAVGAFAGTTTQGNLSVAIGNAAGYLTQGISSVAVGNSAGRSNQGNNAVAIGTNAGGSGQVGNSVAVGFGAGQTSQGGNTVAIGVLAGSNNQVAYAVAVGASAGGNAQGQLAVAVGASAGFTGQGSGAVAIGSQAGNANQGTNAIAIGYGAGANAQPANSIILNASGSVFNANNANAVYVNPVRNDTANIAQALFYNTTTKEVTYAPPIGTPSLGNWTAGTLTVGAVTTAPTLPSNSTSAQWYRQLGPKQWEIWTQFSLSSAPTGSATGSGDYLITLPNGLSFDNTKPNQTANTSAGSWASASYGIPAPGVVILNSTSGSNQSINPFGTVIVPYNSTQYRIYFYEYSYFTTFWGTSIPFSPFAAGTFFNLKFQFTSL